jgi:hypothetical protein
MSGALRGFAARSAEPDLMGWSEHSRLNFMRGMADRMGDPRMQSAMARWAANMEPAIKKAEQLLAEEASPRTLGRVSAP